MTDYCRDDSHSLLTTPLTTCQRGLLLEATVRDIHIPLCQWADAQVAVARAHERGHVDAITVKVPCRNVGRVVFSQLCTVRLVGFFFFFFFYADAA
jgi:hypothetical protein